MNCCYLTWYLEGLNSDSSLAHTAVHICESSGTLPMVLLVNHLPARQKGRNIFFNITNATVHLNSLALRVTTRVAFARADLEQEVFFFTFSNTDIKIIHTGFMYVDSLIISRV